MIMFASVLVEIKAKAVDKTFVYKIPNNLNVLIGERVLVPFGKRIVSGFVLDILTDDNFDYEVKYIKDVIDDYPVINDEMLKLGVYISKKTLSPLICAYQTMLPVALKASKKVKINKKYATFLVVGRKDDFTSSKQEEVFNFVLNNSKVLKRDCELISKSATKNLILKGILKEVKEEVYRLKDDIPLKKMDYKLTAEQKNVIDRVIFDSFKPYLLHGVTGSGKTLVYIKLIERVLKEGKEAILLVPEISLTPQVVDIFKGHFGDTVAILHSALSNGEKYDEWRKIERKEVSIVIGARSAIFAPFTNLGIIIIDEEHSQTYKQENTPRYNTVDIAIKRASNYGCPLVLGSATPSVESYTRAKSGVYELLEMKNRVNNNLPKVFLVDMKDEFKRGNRVFADLTKKKICECLDDDKQVIMLLNRRGYSTVVTCKECGFTHKCPNCDIPLTFHKQSNVMKCHYCDYKCPKLFVCKECGSKNINSLGMGTERLEELVRENFSKAKTIRMDVDTTRTKGSHAKIINDFKNKKYNFLIGTQMISKGLDFEDVTLVCVVNADSSLNIPDFRSAERTFQLLSQTSGRAGRGKSKGCVIMQGFNVNHYSIVTASNHDYVSFYLQEMSIRRQLKYPPFYNLCYVKISGKNFDVVNEEALKIAAFLRGKLSKNIVLGPSAAMVPKINNVYYVGIVIKFKKTREIMEYLKFINNRYATNGKVFIDIDLNPSRI